MRYDAIPSDLFKLNRTAFAKQMKKNSMAVFVSNEPVTRSADAAYKWRQNPDTFSRRFTMSPLLSWPTFA